MNDIKPLKLKFFTAREIKPEGWTKRQLEIQAQGLSGNLDKFWPDIKDSKWIGGNCEGWERVPYWLDGFIPLAYLLDNEDMKVRAKRYIDAIIANQQEDGWICPCTIEERNNYDVWAVFLIAKVLVLYYECTGDERIEKCVYGALKNLEAHIDRSMLFDWAQTRWFESLLSIYWLYERCREDWLINLAHKLKAQGFDYDTMYQNWPYKEKTEAGTWSQMNHVVNQAMAVKSGALYSRVSDDTKYERTAELMMDTLDKYHGTVTGIFTGDESLAGVSPVQGTELCSVVELMYSYENLMAVTGDARWGDRLEKLGFNALPAAISPDMWTHQYDQLVNQVQCSVIPKDKVHFTNNTGEAHIFGLEPHYGCCTANFNQGWPKFILSSFMRNDDGIYSTVLMPSSVSTTISGANVKVTLKTDYPFNDTLTYTISTDKEVDFKLGIRIPAWVEGAVVDGKPAESGQFHTIERNWSGESRIAAKLPMNVQFISRPNNLYTVSRGPLLYSLKISSDWKMIDYGLDEKIKVFPHCDYEVYPTTPFNYALWSKDIEFIFNGVSDIPFSEQHPPVTASAKGVNIDWKANYGVLSEMPSSVGPLNSPEDIELIPYGCTTLRVTELPIIQ